MPSLTRAEFVADEFLFSTKASVTGLTVVVDDVVVEVVISTDDDDVPFELKVVVSFEANTVTNIVLSDDPTVLAMLDDEAVVDDIGVITGVVETVVAPATVVVATVVVAEASSFFSSSERA